MNLEKESSRTENCLWGDPVAPEGLERACFEVSPLRCQGCPQLPRPEQSRLALRSPEGQKPASGRAASTDDGGTQASWAERAALQLALPLLNITGVRMDSPIYTARAQAAAVNASLWSPTHPPPPGPHPSARTGPQTTAKC